MRCTSQRDAVTNRVGAISFDRANVGGLHFWTPASVDQPQAGDSAGVLVGLPDVASESGVTESTVDQMRHDDARNVVGWRVRNQRQGCRVLYGLGFPGLERGRHACQKDGGELVGWNAPDGAAERLERGAAQTGDGLARERDFAARDLVQGDDGAGDVGLARAAFVDDARTAISRPS